MTLAASFSRTAHVSTTEKVSPTRTAPVLVRHQHCSGSACSVWADAVNPHATTIPATVVHLIESRSISAYFFPLAVGAPPPPQHTLTRGLPPPRGRQGLFPRGAAPPPPCSTWARI